MNEQSMGRKIESAHEGQNLETVVNDIKGSDSYKEVMSLFPFLQETIDRRLEVFNAAELNPKAMEQVLAELSGNLESLVEDEREQQKMKDENSWGTFLEISMEQKGQIQKAIQERQEQIERDYAETIREIESLRDTLQSELDTFMKVDSHVEGAWQLSQFLDVQKSSWLQMMEESIEDLRNGQINKVKSNWDQKWYDAINFITQGELEKSFYQRQEEEKSDVSSVFGEEKILPTMDEKELKRILSYIPEVLQKVRSDGSTILEKI